MNMNNPAVGKRSEAFMEPAVSQTEQNITPSILVVDDDLLILEFMADLLRKAGYDVMTAQGGLAAMDILKTHSPQVIFLDLVMPGIDGKNLCRVIRKMKQFKDAYITIISATLAEDPIRITELGANACIAKGPLPEMAQNVIFVLREPDVAASRCSAGEILGMGHVYPRIMTRQLLSLNNHFRRIMGKTSQAVMELNAEGRILFANPAALALFSIAEEQVIGLQFSNLFEDDGDRCRVETLLDPLNEASRRIPYENPVVLNRHFLSLEVVPHIQAETSLTVLMTDVTEQKKEVDVFKGREHQLTQVIFNNSDAMIVTDSLGIIRLMNPAAETLFGQDSGSMVGSSFGYPLLTAKVTELDVFTRNGEQRVVEMCVTETEWAEKPAYLASIRDITKRVRMENALEEANRKILEQQASLVEEERLKVMLQMAGATAHELNQPLSVLLGNLELLEINSDDPKGFSECLRDINASGKRIADTVKKIQNIRYYETRPRSTRGNIIDIDQDVHILSIEDSDADFETIGAVLREMARVKLSRAKTIAEAILLLTDGNIDLILLDYVLTDGNGFDFMKRAREKGIETPVVILTGKGDEMIASRLIRDGASDYLTKAVFNGEIISRCIMNILEQIRFEREMRLAQRKMGQMATTDALTGLHNRRYLFDTLDQEKKRAQRYGTDLVVCMIDLDHFKRINDIHGHPAGDAVLLEIGNLLKRWARETDFPCRYGGEEFAVILPSTNLEGGRLACERLRRMVSEHRFVYGDMTLHVTISIGMAQYGHTSEETVSDLIKRADEALYRAKREGRNRVIVNLEPEVL